MTAAQHILTLDRVFDAPVANIWRCWAEPELFSQWFLPVPWRVSDVKIDLQDAGEFSCVMNGSNGERYEYTGVFLDILREKRIVHTNVFRHGWIPSGHAFMVVHINLAEIEGNKTHYVAESMYWNAQTKAEHEKKGLYANWNKAADQLEALARSLTDSS